MELPAIEKISEEQEGDAFQVLIGTMLSAQTRDPVTHEASTRLLAVAPSPGVLAGLPLKRIERLFMTCRHPFWRVARSTAIMQLSMSG